MFRRIVYKQRDADGTYTVWWSDGSIDKNVTITDGGIDPQKPGTLPPLGGVTPAPGVEALGKLGDGVGLAAGVANNVFNPFQLVIESFDSEAGQEIRARSRKAGIIAILIVLAILFVYLTFKD